jgi:ADP-ribosylglycohydrolase
MSIEDKKRGAFWGLIIGDALGAPVEFKMPGEFVPVTDYQSGGPHSLNKGEWTDDTSLALALADSLANGWNTKDQLDKYCSWYEEGKYSVNGWCFDIGGTTKHALENYRDSGNPETCGLADDDYSGNGSIMRLAPVPIKYSELFFDLDELIRLAEESSATTHASKKCRDCCAYLATLIAGLINGIDREILLNDPYYIPPKVCTAVRLVAEGSYRKNKVKGSGYVVESLEAALWAFHKAENFRKAVLAAVNLGDDADTTAAVCGQLAGAYWGFEAIPEEWRINLAKNDLIEGYFNALIK